MLIALLLPSLYFGPSLDCVARMQHDIERINSGLLCVRDCINKADIFIKELQSIDLEQGLIENLELRLNSIAEKIQAVIDYTVIDHAASNMSGYISELVDMCNEIDIAHSERLNNPITEDEWEYTCAWGNDSIENLKESGHDIESYIRRARSEVSSIYRSVNSSEEARSHPSEFFEYTGLLHGLILTCTRYAKRLTLNVYRASRRMRELYGYFPDSDDSSCGSSDSDASASLASLSDSHAGSDSGADSDSDSDESGATCSTSSPGSANILEYFTDVDDVS